MTWPQYLRNECSVENFVIHLSPQETELLSTLLMRYPNPVPAIDLLEVVYPNPDDEPEHPENVIAQRMIFLGRKLGTFRIQNEGAGRGYKLYQTQADLNTIKNIFFQPDRDLWRAKKSTAKSKKMKLAA